MLRRQRILGVLDSFKMKYGRLLILHFDIFFFHRTTIACGDEMPIDFQFSTIYNREQRAKNSFESNENNVYGVILINVSIARGRIKVLKLSLKV